MILIINISYVITNHNCILDTTHQRIAEQTGSARQTDLLKIKIRMGKEEEKIKVDENGIKIFHEIIGHNYLKDTVYEVFDVKEVAREL